MKRTLDFWKTSLNFRINFQDNFKPLMPLLSLRSISIYSRPRLSANQFVAEEALSSKNARRENPVKINPLLYRRQASDQLITNVASLTAITVFSEGILYIEDPELSKDSSSLRYNDCYGSYGLRKTNTQRDNIT